MSAAPIANLRIDRLLRVVGPIEPLRGEAGKADGDIGRKVLRR